MTNCSPELPESVRNLRRIWDSKRIEEGFTQKGATLKLGITQGAISQYLNDITSLSAATTIKFANFLNVSPLDIDPALIESLPGVSRLRIYAATSATMKMKSTGATLYKLNNEDSSFCVKLKNDATLDGAPIPEWMVGCMVELSSAARSTWARPDTVPKPVLFASINKASNSCALLSVRNQDIRNSELILWSVVSIIPQ